MKNLINTLELTINADVELFGVVDITPDKTRRALDQRANLIKLVEKDSLAYKILQSIHPILSQKQIYIIAKALENTDFHKEVIVRDNRANAIRNQKEEAKKDKLAANKEASADVLAPIKAIRKIGAFGKWLNTSGNPYRSQNFNKKYTVEAVNAFLATL